MITSKSYDDYLLGLYRAMLNDIVVLYPKLHVECDRDYKRLLSAVKQHGSRFLFETLPAFGKHFDCALRDGLLIRSGLPHFRGFRYRGPIPRLFRGLVLRVFDESGVLRSVPDVQAISAVRQLCFAAKRFRVACEPHSTWEQVNEFIRTEGEIVQSSLCWDTGDFDSSRSSDLHLGDHVRLQSAHPNQGVFDFSDCDGASNPERAYERCDAIQRTADIIVALLGRFNPSEWGSRHGPGAVSDLRDKSWKYDFPTWPDKLESVFPYADFGFHNHAAWADTLNHQASLVASSDEKPAKLIAVPKAFSGPRLIASEPTSHQWCQQILRDFLMTRVRDLPFSKSIKFDDQTWNGSLALEASLSGSHATIDLSSASDRISCWLVERLFRRSPSLLDAFYAVRTRYIVQDIDKFSLRHLRLRKFSTMGSALTFPVQTYVFTIIAIGNLLFQRGIPVNIGSIRKAAREVRVFGDDIIVPTDVWVTTVEMLQCLRLKVNTNKTFGTGMFRESCGVDAYSGHDVTKVSVLASPSVAKPESVLSSVDVSNNFYKRGWYGTSSYVRSSVERLRRFTFPVVAPDSGAVGWHSHIGLDTTGLKTRWNSDLQRVEYRITSPRGKVIRAPLNRVSEAFQYFIEVKGRPDVDCDRIGALPLKRPLRLGWSWVPVEKLVKGIRHNISAFADIS